MKKLGVIIFFAINIITIILWTLSKDGPSLLSLPVWKSLGQLAGLIAATTISLEFFLSARLKLVERLFGGLDKVYKIHALAGAMSLIFSINHPIFLAINVLPSSQAATKYLLPSLDNWAFLVGFLALYALLLLVLLTLLLKLPYKIWKFTHYFMVVPLIMVIWHMLIIPSDISNYLPLKVWLVGISGVALFFYIYKKFFYSNSAARHSYSLSAVEVKQHLIELVLKPAGKALQFMPGQFAYISIDSPGFSKDEHPFSLASAPSDSFLHLGIKPLGELTTKLANLPLGADIKVYGPYGTFGDRQLTSNKDSVWIAGGIGVTPFLSLLRYYSQNFPSKKIWFYYINKTIQDLDFLDEIKENSSQSQNIKIIPYASEVYGRFSVDSIKPEVVNFKDKLFLICGPRKMMEDITWQLVSAGVHPRNIVIEDFNFFA